MSSSRTAGPADMRLRLLVAAWATCHTMMAVAEKASGTPEVELYEAADYHGVVSKLNPGRYDWEHLGISEKGLTAVKVPPGFKVTLFEDRSFQGRRVELTSDTPNLDATPLGFNDRTSSVVVELLIEASDGHVSVFEDPGFEGRHAELKVGKYDADFLGIPQNSLSSVKVPEGLKVSIFDKRDFLNKSHVLVKDTPDLSIPSLDADNKISSIIVEVSDEKHVSIFEDPGFKGRHADLKVGKYNADFLGIPRGSLSSVKVPEGLKLTLFENRDFMKKSLVLFADAPDLSVPGLDADDKTSSIIVEGLHMKATAAFWSAEHKASALKRAAAVHANQARAHEDSWQKKEPESVDEKEFIEVAISEGEKASHTGVEPLQLKNDSCLLKEVTWEPLDMSGQLLSIEANWSQCRHRCRQTPSCESWAFHEALGHCHVQDFFAQKTEGRIGFVSGKSDCSQEEFSNNITDGLEFKSLSNCYKENWAYQPLDNADPEGFAPITSTIIECQLLCQKNDRCSFFTYSGLDRRCHMTSSDSQATSSSFYMVGGPKHCPRAISFAIVLDDIWCPALDHNHTYNDELNRVVALSVAKMVKDGEVNTKEVDVKSFCLYDPEDPDNNEMDWFVELDVTVLSSAEKDKAQHMMEQIDRPEVLKAYLEPLLRKNPLIAEIDGTESGGSPGRLSKMSKLSFAPPMTEKWPIPAEDPTPFPGAEITGAEAEVPKIAAFLGQHIRELELLPSKKLSALRFAGLVSLLLAFAAVAPAIFRRVRLLSFQQVEGYRSLELPQDSVGAPRDLGFQQSASPSSELLNPAEALRTADVL